MWYQAPLVLPSFTWVVEWDLVKLVGAGSNPALGVLLWLVPACLLGPTLVLLLWSCRVVLYIPHLYHSHLWGILKGKDACACSLARGSHLALCLLKSVTRIEPAHFPMWSWYLIPDLCPVCAGCGMLISLHSRTHRGSVHTLALVTAFICGHGWWLLCGITQEILCRRVVGVFSVAQTLGFSLESGTPTKLRPMTLRNIGGHSCERVLTAHLSSL